MPGAPTPRSERAADPAAESPAAADATWLGPAAHALLDAVDVGVIVYDRDGRIVDANRTGLALVGFELDEVKGRFPSRGAAQAIRPDGTTITTEDLPIRTSIREQRSVTAEIMGLRRRDGTLLWLRVSAWPLVIDGEPVGAVATMTDHTATHEVEQAERTVTAATQVLVRATDAEVLMADMCQTIVDAGRYALAWIGRAEHDAERSVSVLAAAGAVAHVHDDPVSWSPDHHGADGPTGTCLRTGTVQVCDGADEENLPASWRARFEASGFGSALAIPLDLSPSERGVLTIYSDEIRAFERRSRALLVDLAKDLEYGLRHLATTDALAASESRFRLLAENTGDVVLLTTDGIIDWVSPSVEAALGWEPESLVGAPFASLTHPDDSRRVAHARVESRAGVRATYRGRLRRREGTWVWFDARSRPLLDAEGRPDDTSVTTIWETTAEVAAQEALAHAATHDALTGLANRSLLLAELDRALDDSRRSGLATGVLLLDLDHFKYVNDSLGHAVGDELLETAARRMLDAVRAGDLVARPGGDEFAVVMRNLTEPHEALGVGQRLVEAFRRPIVVGDAELFTTASVGVAVAGKGDHDALDLLRDADTAMYQAKDAGRDRLSLFNQELRDSITQRVRLVNELRTALARDELAVWYQPEIGLEDGRIRAVEALLRWHHPSGELYTAARFIETAEETGLILDIGRWVVRQSCQQAAEWLSRRPDHPLVVRVNLSTLQLAEAGLLEDLDEALASSGLHPRRLCVEITETAMLHETSTVRANMAGIHERGIRVAIDDFGTGYASLTYLRRYPVDVVKLDRSFVSTIVEQRQDEHIIAGIIHLARRLGISVTAEGVERTEQADLLQGLGCTGAQGYLYSRAVPAADLEALLDADEPLG